MFKSKSLLLLYALVSIIGSINAIAYMFVFGLIIDSAKYSENKFILFSIIILSFSVFYVLISYLYELLQSIVLKKTTLGLKKDIFDAVIDKDIVDFEKENTSYYVAELTSKINLYENIYFRNISKLPNLIFTFAIAFAVAFYTDIKILIVIFFISAAMMVFSRYFGTLKEKTMSLLSDEISSYISCISDYFEGFQVIKVNNLANKIISFHNANNEMLEIKKFKNSIVSAKSNFCFMIINFIGELSIMCIVANYALNGSFSAGFVYTAAILTACISGPLIQLFEMNIDFKAAKPLEEGFRNLLNNNYKSNGGEYMSKEYNIKLNNLSFSYDNNKKALDNVSFDFKFGKKYAVVGMSGSGKTTLLRLLMGYYKNYSGDIFYGDTELRSINLESLYASISIVHQSTFLFEDTIKNNILLYSDYDEDKLKYIIRQVGLSDYVNLQENGIEHIISESGKNLSGGEKQRISIARALIKDCKILLLDEFTSNLDTELSYEIEKNVLELSDKSVICITHKLNKNILKLFDEILVMKNGRIIENGNFDKLMNDKSMLYSMYNIEN